MNRDFFFIDEHRQIINYLSVHLLALRQGAGFDPSHVSKQRDILWRAKNAKRKVQSQCFRPFVILCSPGRH